MAGPAEQVNSVFSQAQDYAASAQGLLGEYLGALNNEKYTPINYDITWKTPEPLPAPPQKPQRPPRISEAAFSYRPPNSKPGPLNEEAPNDPDIPPVPNLRIVNIPEPGETTIPELIPEIPDIGTVPIPGAPNVTFGAMGALMSISSIQAPSIDLREDWLQRLENMPTLEILQPVPYSYARGPEYTSQLLNGLKAKLNERLAGGTGLPPAIEQAIWDRARGREVAASRAAEREVMRNSEALGYVLPAGVTAHQLQEAQQGTATRLAELSRDIAVKQADLEQANMREAISAGMQLEKQLIEYSSEREQLSFQAARAVAEMGIAAYNGRLQHLQTLMQGYQTLAAGYKTIIEGELAKVDVFKARVEAERSKTEVNRAVVEQYKASIEAGMAQVEIYKAQVGGAQAQIEYEKAKVSAAGERVRGFVAQINAESAKLEGYKARVSALASQQSAEVAKISAFGTRAQAQGDVSRARISRYEAVVRAKAGEWDGFRAEVQAEQARIAALGTQASAYSEEYKIDGNMYVAQSGVELQRWDKSVLEYKQGLEFVERARKEKDASLKWSEEARRESAKVSAQVYAQLTASAYGMLNASASISGSGSNSVSYNYSGSI